MLQTTLGEGTFGAVYLADMESAGGFKRRVALKLLHPSWDPGSDAGRRLRDEARLLGRLEHRHIVRVDDLLRLDGRWALVMEYVAGADLEVVAQTTRSAHGEIPVVAALNVAEAVASAMQAAYNAPGDDGRPLNVIHRDIKPSNIRLSETGEVKVLDFGVARADFAGRESKTERVRYGSLGYMAPERLLGGDEVLAGDVYAVGAVLYEMLCLTSLGRAELGMEAQAAQVEGARERIRERLGERGEAVASFVGSMLAYAPENRPTLEAVQAEARRLARTFEDDDIVTFARARLPAMRAAVDDSVKGRVMEESPSGGMPVVNSGTLVLPVDAMTGAAAVPSPSTTFVHVDETPPKRTALYVTAALAALVVVAIGGVALYPWQKPALVAAPIVPAAVVSPPAPPVAPDAVAALDPAAAPDAAVALASPVAPTPGAAPAATPPEAAPSAAPRPSAPRPPTSAAAPVAPSPAAPSPAATPVAAPSPASPSTPRLRSAKFSLVGGENLTVDCGGVTGSGQASVLLRDLPAGVCVVRAGGKSASITIDAPRGVDCTLAGESLTCR